MFSKRLLNSRKPLINLKSAFNKFTKSNYTITQ